MAVTTTPIFAQTPLGTPTPVSATANTTRAKVAGATPTNGVALTPASNVNGIRVDSVKLVGTGTTLAGVIVLWDYDGTDSNLIAEFAVTVATPSTTAVGFSSITNYTDFSVPAGHRLYATSTVASQLINVNVCGGAY